jgi:hypothetical protein
VKSSESNGNEILSDGRRVWVNGKSGEALARLSSFGATAMIDVHRPITEQRVLGSECLDCRHDLQGAAAWDHFVAAALRHFGVVVGEKHRPRWAKATTAEAPGSIVP